MMKRSIKRAVVVVIPAVLIILSAAIAVTAAWKNYREGNIILINPMSLTSAMEKLDIIGIPCGTGSISYSGKEYAFIESRAELMPVIENCLRSSGVSYDEMISVYRQAHTALFWTITASAVSVCMYCMVMSFASKKKIPVYLFITAAFLTAVGSLYWLGTLTLTML